MSGCGSSLFLKMHLDITQLLA